MSRFQRSFHWPCWRIRGIFLSFLLCSLFLLNPNQSQAQALFGDPSLTAGGFGQVKLEIGGGSVTKQKLKFDDTTIPVQTTSKTFLIDSPRFTEEVKSEQLYLTTTLGLGSFGDLFAKVGQNKIKNSDFNGSSELAEGVGIRISPPQNGPIKIGLLLQAFHEQSKDDNISLGFQVFDAAPNDPDNTFLQAVGRGAEKLTITRYDVLLGFSAQHLPYIRPYAGLLMTTVKGKDNVSGSGRATLSSCPRAGGTCSGSTQPFSTSFKAKFESDQTIGGVAGFVFNPTETIGMTLESQFESQFAYMLAAFFHF